MDLIVCSLPKSNCDSPLLGPCVVSAAAKASGFSSKVLDFNIQLYRHLKETGTTDAQWIELDYTFQDQNLFDEFVQRREIDLLINSWVDQIRDEKPKFVGITAFSKSNTRMIRYFCQLLRAAYPAGRIILGGPESYFCGENLARAGLVDKVVSGYGESAIIATLSRGATGPPLHSGEPAITKSPTFFCSPDYSDLDMSLYRGGFLSVSASRGCLRKCQFCAVYSVWGPLVNRKAEDVVGEMRHGFEKYNITKFHFTDSTFNGSIEHQREICRQLIKVPHQFEWQAFVNILPKRKSNSDDIHLLSNAGCRLLKVGVESGSERLRREMGKPFTNQELFLFLEELGKTEIRCDLFFMVGYPSETEEEFVMTMDLISELRQFQGSIAHLRVAPTTVHEGTKLWANKDTSPASFSESKDTNSDLSAQSSRFERYQSLRNHIFQSGFKIRHLEDIRMQLSVKRGLV
ncbi:MAG: B12-binding domain-containing radical SAM protein [Bdellovibrionaceae bacterium]|nr:B12-binding domain-containing radical SAM protein [Bdellovibrionales bacterium]MCB9086168.1 B12-binding domain-containing radical SAM protein [Pseudobdellovibrionaceae bacterium]